MVTIMTATMEIKLYGYTSIGRSSVAQYEVSIKDTEHKTVGCGRGLSIMQAYESALISIENKLKHDDYMINVQHQNKGDNPVA